MGKGQSKLSSDDLKALADKTKFDTSKIKMWYKGFMADCPQGHMSLEFFVRVYKQFFPFGDPAEFSEQLFRLFDADGDGLIKFEEFMVALSVTALGDTDTKLRWAFRLYDLDDDKSVSYEDMVTVIGYIYRMVGSSVRLPEDEDTPDKRVAKLFRTWGIPRGHCLDVDQFVNFSKKTPDVTYALNIYNGLV